MDGIINVYKERDWTSHDVVAKLRGILKQKKIGHTGTLDPEAQGVLPVCLGRATKVCELLTDQTKTYQAVMLLGQTTDTQDTTGTVQCERPVCCSEKEVRICIAGFVGEQEQIPPMYSALKVNGKKLYELARQGVEVERKARTITIASIRIDAVKLPEVTMTVTCSKGTYIRTLCHDIGERLGCGGCMKSLLRTQVGPFALSDSVKLEEIERARDTGRLSEVVHHTDSVFMQLPFLILTPQMERLVKNGNPLPMQMLRSMRGDAAVMQRNSAEVQEHSAAEAPQVLLQMQNPADADFLQKAAQGTQIRIYGTDGSFLAVYEKREDQYRAVKMFL